MQDKVFVLFPLSATVAYAAVPHIVVIAPGAGSIQLFLVFAMSCPILCCTGAALSHCRDNPDAAAGVVAASARASLASQIGRQENLALMNAPRKSLYFSGNNYIMVCRT
jgi:hypothetical protein